MIKRNLLLTLIVAFSILSCSVAVVADEVGYDWDFARSCDYDRYVATTDGGVNLRSEPNTGGVIYATIPDFTLLHISAETENGWGETQYGGQQGWVALSQLSDVYPADGTQQVVTVAAADGVNLREGPDVSYPVLRGTIPPGTELTVTEVYTKKNWGKITFGGITGWIALSEVRDGAAAPAAAEAPADTAPATTDVTAEPDDSTTTAVPATTSPAEADLVEPAEEGGISPLLIVIGLIVFVIVVTAILLILIVTKK